MAGSSVEICPVSERTPELVNLLVRVWERSVRATHEFLSDAEVAEIKPFVPQRAISEWRAGRGREGW